MQKWFESINNDEIKSMIKNIYDVLINNSNLNLSIKWDNLFITFNDSFIIALAPYKKHISIALDKKILNIYIEQLIDMNYELTNNLFKIGVNQKINIELIQSMVNSAIDLTKDKKTFW